jgi:hypothetical protein
MIEFGESDAAATHGMNSDAVVLHVDPRKNAALEAYTECGTVAGAARAANVSRQTFYDWMEKDPEFAAAVADCRTALADDLEDEAIKERKRGPTR